MMAARLLEFIAAMTRLTEQGLSDEAKLLESAAPLMRALVRHDDWLPTVMAVDHPQFYQQHLLYGDPLDRFSLVSFVWGPGQKTPIHDHTVWGIIAMLRGAELGQQFARDDSGRLTAVGQETRLEPGEIEMVSPTLGDIHQVSNAFTDQVSISIHLYGGNIGRISRHVFAPETGAPKDFISGYSNALCPNLWAREAA